MDAEQVGHAVGSAISRFDFADMLEEIYFSVRKMGEKSQIDRIAGRADRINAFGDDAGRLEKLDFGKLHAEKVSQYFF